MKLDIINKIDEFVSLGGSWNDLLSDAALDNPFQSHQWLLTWWQVYGTGTLHVITCRDTVSGELIGALPLYKSNVGGILGVTTIRFLGSRQGSADFLGCIARQSLEPDIFKACLGTLLQGSGRWDLIELQDMDANSPFCCFLREARIAGIVETRDSGKCCPYLHLPDSWDLLLNRLSKKVRQRIGYYRRALDRKGAVVLEVIGNPEELSGAMSDMVRLRQDRMEQKGITTAVVTDSYRRFHGDLVPRMLACEKLHLYFLCVDGQRIAYLYLFSGGSGVYFYQTGFDRSWSNQSVGFVLLSMVIEKSIADGYKTFEFLRGEERYKYEWGNVEEKFLSNISIYKRNPYGLTMQLLNNGINFIRSYKRFIPLKAEGRN